MTYLGSTTPLTEAQLIDIANGTQPATYNAFWVGSENAIVGDDMNFKYNYDAPTNTFSEPKGNPGSKGKPKISSNQAYADETWLDKRITEITSYARM